MRLALLSDLHANLQALEACLSHARSQGADRFAFIHDDSRTRLVDSGIDAKLRNLPARFSFAIHGHQQSPFGKELEPVRGNSSTSYELICTGKASD